MDACCEICDCLKLIKADVCLEFSFVMCVCVCVCGRAFECMHVR